MLTEILDRGIDPTAHTNAWREAADLLAAFDAIGRAGGTAIVKVDGGRGGRDVFTVLLSNDRLGERSFRNDGDDLAALLREAIAYWVLNASSARP